MEKSVWIYRLGEDEYGPFTATEIWHKIEEGVIDDETLIKGQDEAQWQPLKEIKELHLEFLDVTPPVVKPDLENIDRPKEEQLRRLVRPWARFWARMIDYSLLYLLVLALTYSLHLPRHFGWPLWAFFAAVTLVWVVIEAALLHTIGTTPGKWYLQVHLTTKEKKKPTFKRALHRSFYVWWRGVGCALPFISFGTAILAHISLENHRETAWDRSGGFDVIHKRIGFFRTFFTAVYFVLLTSLLKGGLGTWIQN